MPFSITSVATGVNGTSADVTISTLPANTSAQLLQVSARGTFVVRATLPTAATGTLVVNDPYVPFGVAVTYRVVAYGTPTTQTVDAAAPFTLNYATALVTDSGTGASIPVVVAGQTSRRYEARSVFYDVIGRSGPVVATQPARLMSGQLVFRCADLTARNELAAYLAAGYPLVLRTPFPAGTDDVAFLASDWDDEPAFPSAGPYALTVNYQAVDMSGVPYWATSMTYAKLATSVTTYANLTNLYATYLKLAGA